MNRSDEEGTTFFRPLSKKIAWLTLSMKHEKVRKSMRDSDWLVVSISLGKDELCHHVNSIMHEKETKQPGTEIFSSVLWLTNLKLFTKLVSQRWKKTHVLVCAKNINVNFTHN
jgi:hypothetical protein